MDKLDIAIRAFEDETNDLTLGERVALLRDALMWRAVETIKKINKQGTKAQASADDDFKQSECMKLYNQVEKMYASTLKMNKLSGKSEAKMHQDFMKSIRDMKSPMGGIVRKLGENEEGRVASGV